MSDLARILDVIAAAAGRQDDLAVALRSSGVPGATVAADRLAAGATIPAAVAGIVPPRLASLLAGGTPPLATVATLLADEAWRSATRRRLLVDHLSYPLAALAMVVGLAVALALTVPVGLWYAPVASSGWAALPAALVVLLIVAPWLPSGWRLPGSGWARHLDLAGRWARAALVVRWRLTEAQAATLLGIDLSGFGAALGATDAEVHCRRLADWHRDAAARRLGWTALVLAALILAIGGGVVLGAARMWTNATG